MKPGKWKTYRPGSILDKLGIDVQVLYPTIFIEQITDKVEWEIAICKG